MRDSSLKFLLVLGLSLAGFVMSPAWAQDAFDEGAADGTPPEVAAAPSDADASSEGLPMDEGAVEEAVAGEEESLGGDSMDEGFEAIPMDTEDEPAASDSGIKSKGKIPLGMVGYDAEGQRGWLHVVRTGETLWHISDAYFGTPWIWPSVWRDNDATIINPHRINPGDALWITAKEIRPVTPEQAEAFLAGEPARSDDPQLRYMLPEEELKEGFVYFSAIENADFVATKAMDAQMGIVGATTQQTSLGEGDEIVISRGSAMLQVGDQLTIYRSNEKVYRPGTGRLFGYLVDILGWAKVTAVHDEVADAKIQISRGDIWFGDALMPRVEPVTEIKLIPASRPVEGQVIAMPDGRLSAMIDDVVYLDKGETAGLQVGNVLEVIRKSALAPDSATGERSPRTKPDVVVGTMVVVGTYSESSVALIRTSSEFFEVGDYYRMGGIE